MTGSIFCTCIGTCPTDRKKIIQARSIFSFLRVQFKSRHEADLKCLTWIFSFSVFFTLALSAGNSPGNRRNGSKILSFFDWPEETSRLGKARAEGSAEPVRLEFSFLLKVPQSPQAELLRTAPGVNWHRAGISLLWQDQSIRDRDGSRAVYNF
jgi:hypothetical protein